MKAERSSNNMGFMVKEDAVPSEVNAARRTRRNAHVLETGSLGQSLGYMVRRAQLAVYTEFHEAMAAFEIRPAQYAVMVLIRANPGMTQTAISAALGIQKANFVALLDHLVARALVERRRVGSDKRSFALHLTRSGKPFVQRMERAHAELEIKLSQRIQDGNSALLLSMLEDLCGHPATTPSQD